MTHWHWSTSRHALVVVATLMSVSLAAMSGGVAFAQSAPASTTSRYMSTVDGNVLYNDGCASGGAGENGIVILDFGQPWFQNGSYGTILYDAGGTFASTGDIEFAAESFLRGYWACAPGDTFVRLAIGTSNYRGSTGSGHGAAWAALVDAVGAWIDSPPSYAAQETARGANDLEMGWNSAAASRAWTDGYASTTGTPYYDYGDCEGCPTGSGIPGAPGWTINNGWTQDDVWYVAYGNPAAYPVPEIYLNNGVNAAQWQRLSLYANENHGGPIYFLGTLTQSGACSGGCSGANNSPSDGWSQLYGWLNSDWRTAQELNYASDITWNN